MFRGLFTGRVQPVAPHTPEEYWASLLLELLITRPGFYRCTTTRKYYKKRIQNSVEKLDARRQQTLHS